MPKLLDITVFVLGIITISLFFLAITGSAFGLDTNDKTAFLIYSVMVLLAGMILLFLRMKKVIK